MIQAKNLEATEESRGHQFSEVTGVICRKATGKLDFVVFDHYEAPEHKAKREAAGVELPKPTFSVPPVSGIRGLIGRLARKVLPYLGIIAIAFGALHSQVPAKALGPAVLLGATVIVNGGQAVITNLASGLGGTVPKFVAWGTGAGTAAVTDTTLFTESTDEARTSGTVTRVTTTVTNDTTQTVGLITVATSGKTLTNVGMFDAITTGNLYFKSDFTGVPLLVGDSITFTIKVKFA